MSVIDELLKNNEGYAADFDKGDLPKDSIRGFVYEVETGNLREVS